MNSRLALASSCQRLIMGKDNAIILGIGLMGPRRYPCLVTVERWVIAADVITEHVKVWTPMEHPARHLVPTASSKHHATAVEPDTVEEALHIRVFSCSGVEREFKVVGSYRGL